MIKFSVKEINHLTEIERKAISKLRERISDTFHLRQLVLFGSQARGNFKLSDISFEINMKYDTQLTCILENADDWFSEADSIWLLLKDNITQEGIALEI